MAEKKTAKEWSSGIGNWSIGIFRKSVSLGAGETNCFIPLMGAHP
jgi:hypothetical protein